MSWLTGGEGVEEVAGTFDVDLPRLLRMRFAERDEVPSREVDDGPRSFPVAHCRDRVSIAKVNTMYAEGRVCLELVKPLQSPATAVVEYGDGMPS